MEQGGIKVRLRIVLGIIWDVRDYVCNGTTTV